MRLRCRPPNRPSPHCVQKFLIFTMRRVREPYLFSALNRCRRVQLAVEQTCSHTVANWPVAVAQMPVAALQGHNWPVAACVGVERVRDMVREHVAGR